MVDTAVVQLTEALSSEVSSHVRMIAGAKDELERLENDVRLLSGFLHDVDMNEAVRSSGLDLERQIKELVYAARDIREFWLIHRAAVTAAAKTNNWLRYLNLKGMGVYRLARKISSTRDGRVDPLFRRIEAFGELQLQGLPKHPTKVKQVPSVQLNSEFPPIRLEKVVGFKDDAKSLINCLMKETEELDVISITGMPGIGKTTLAWKIYQDETIRSEFPTRIWVDIPLSFNSKDLYLDMLKEFFKQGMVSYDELVIWFDMPQKYYSKETCVEILDEFTESGRINDHQLLDAIHACLKKSKFLLVMDDVWTADYLESIRCFLPKMGKVLITSRNSHVTPKPHELHLLNEKESWDLLELEVFGKLGDCPDTLKPVRERIAKSCDGLPLAILIVASSLVVPSSADAADDLTENSWMKVSENVMTYVKEYGDQHSVFERVESSYTRLPQFMQDCFLYLGGVFPEGQEIPVWTLIRLWIAEGLVQDSWGLTLEETAERNLYDLISKNLVMVGKIYPNGLIKTCRLHKVIYAFCKYKAVEQEFYHEIRLSRGGALDSPVSLNLNHRRLCINSCLSEFLSSRPHGPCIGSLLCHNKNGTEVLHPMYSTTIHRSFKLLKIFECKCVKFPKFPKMLSKLMNLRYISLSCDDLDVIPDTISSLIYLETLVVDTQSDSFKLKANIWRMFKLRHLVTKAAIVISIRANSEASNNLQTLTRLAPACCTEYVLARTPNLKTLGIRGKLSNLSDAEAVRRLEFLENLKLINEPAADIQWQPDCFPPNLKRLTLSGTYLGWQSMSVLGKIDGLEILKLKNNAFVGRSWNSTVADGFDRLGFLMIATTDLVSWEASDECFPSLKCLVLRNCEKLEKIPSTLAKSIDTLDVEKVSSESVMESAREIEHEIARRLGQSTR